MRLISCHVDNFGKLSNMDINFNEHVNIINQPNGWGKSTLAAFFCAMLYGFDNKKENGALEKDRKKYQPWQGGPYGGTMTFEIDGKKYIISRSFGATERSDEFHVYNAETNVECDDFSDKPGEDLFDIDRTSFKRTIYIAQNECLSSSTDGISAKLGNLAENTNDINNFETAQEKIKELMNSLAPNRITGSIKKRTNTIAQLKLDIKTFDAAERAVEELGEKLEERKAQKQELLDIRQDYAKALRIASEDSRKKELKKSYEALLKELEESDKALQSYRRELPSVVPADEETVEQLVNAKALEEQSIIARNLMFTQEEETSYAKLKETFKAGLPTDEQIEEKLSDAGNIIRVENEHNQLEMKLSQMQSVAMLTEQETVETSIKKSGLVPGGIVALIVGIIGAGAGIGVVVALAKYAMYAFIGIGVGTALAVLGIILILVGKNTNTKRKRELTRKLEEREEQKKAKEEPIIEMRTQLLEIEDGIEVLKKDVFDFVATYGISCEESQIQSKLYELKNQIKEFQRLQDKEAKYEEAESRYDLILSELNAFAQSIGVEFSDEIAGDLNRIKAKSAECRLLQKQYDVELLKKQQFEQEHEVEAIMSDAECPYSLEELNTMIREVETRTQEVQEGIEQYTRQIEDLQEQLDLRDEKLQELSNALEIQEEEQHKYGVLDLTRKYLQDAKEQFTARYMAPISDGFQKYYGILTRDESRNWLVDANISFKMREYGELRDANRLSCGYQDLIGICMRFALVDAMYQEEKPFLILDDPFVNLDDEKTSHGEELLIELENQYQVIYFTCHESREYHE